MCTIIGIAIGVYYEFYANDTIARNSNLSNIRGLDLNKISKYKIKMDNGKTLKFGYGHTLAELADNYHEESLALAELYGHSEFIQQKWLKVKNVILILLLKTIVLMNAF